MSKVYFFTNSFPYGIGEQWKLNELTVMSSRFAEVEVIPFKFDGNQVAKIIPFENVRFDKPLFGDEALRLKGLDFARVFLSRYTLFFLKEFLTRFVFVSKPTRSIGISTRRNARKLMLPGSAVSD